MHRSHWCNNPQDLVLDVLAAMGGGDFPRDSPNMDISSNIWTIKAVDCILVMFYTYNNCTSWTSGLTEPIVINFEVPNLDHCLCQIKFDDVYNLIVQLTMPFATNEAHPSSCGRGNVYDPFVCSMQTNKLLVELRVWETRGKCTIVTRKCSSNFNP